MNVSPNNLTRASVPRQGMTLPELCLGLLVTGLVLAAMSSFVMAVASHWRASDGSQEVMITANQAAARIDAIVKTAKQLGACSNGSLSPTSPHSAAVLIWSADTSGGRADGKIQTSELLLVQHDRATNAIVLYRPNPALGSYVQRQWMNSEFVNTAKISEFRAMATAEPRVPGVTGASFYVHNIGSTQVNPMLDYRLLLGQAKRPQTIYGASTLRGPSSTPE